jgi:flagellar motor switch protein FliG
MARAKKHRNDIGIAAQLRPTVKTLIKEALRAYGAAEEALTEAGEQFEDLVSEARAEMKKALSEARAEMKKALPSRRDNRHKGKS